MTAIAVFGAKGALGRAVVDYLDQRTSTFPVSRGTCNIDDHIGVRKILGEYRPDVVINCAGVIPDRDKDSTGAAMIAANSIGPRVLAHVTGELGMRLIHISTDCVFRPGPGARDALEEPDAYDLYGMSKALGEVSAGHVTNVRCSFVTPDHGVAHWFLTQPYEATVKGYTNKDWNGSTVEEIASHIGEFALGGIGGGALHIASDVLGMTKYDVLRTLQKSFRPDITIEKVGGPTGHLLWPTITCRSLHGAIHDDGVRGRYRALALKVLNA